MATRKTAKLAAGLMAGALLFGVTACSGTTDDSDDATGKVYYLNFKPEQADVFDFFGYAAGGAHHVADRAQRRGLAGAVGAEQGGDGALVEREFEAVQRLHLAVIGTKILDREQRHASLLPR